MRLYEGSISNFRTNLHNNTLVNQIKQAFKIYYNRYPAESEIRAWNQSLDYLDRLMYAARLYDNMMIIEYELPHLTKRIDVLLFADSESDEYIELLELKQWSNGSVRPSDSEGNVFVRIGKNWVALPHPSLQVKGYHNYLCDFVKVLREDPRIKLHSYAYCHSYAKYSPKAVLYDRRFQDILKDHPCYAKKDIDYLARLLSTRLSNGNGRSTFAKFVASPISPSKNLLDHVSSMVKGQNVFSLVDDQIVVYNTIKSKAQHLAKLKKSMHYC